MHDLLMCVLSASMVSWFRTNDHTNDNNIDMAKDLPLSSSDHMYMCDTQPNQFVLLVCSAALNDLPFYSSPKYTGVRIVQYHIFF